MTSIKQRFNTIVIDGDMLCYLASFPTQSERFFVTTLEGDPIIDYPSLKSCENKESKFIFKNSSSFLFGRVTPTNSFIFIFYSYCFITFFI